MRHPDCGQWRCIFSFKKDVNYPDNVHPYVNKSLWNGKQRHFISIFVFGELNKTNCFNRLKHRIGWAKCLVWRCLWRENINPFLYITIRLEVQFIVFLCNIIKRNERFNRNSPFSYKALNYSEMMQIPHFSAVFTITISNLTLIGCYLHYENRLYLNWKQCRFVSEETK